MCDAGAEPHRTGHRGTMKKKDSHVPKGAGQIVELLVSTGIISRDQLLYAQRVHGKLQSPKRPGEAVPFEVS